MTDRSARPARPPVAVIIPARNEAAAIGHVLSHLPGRYIHQVIVVDNGSTDGTSDAARSAMADVTLVREDRPGYGRACLAGIAALESRIAIVVFLDGDFSDDPGDLPRLLAPIIRGRADFVVGSRTRGGAARGSLTTAQIFGNRLATSLLRLGWGKRWTDLGPFRAITREGLDRLGMRDRGFGWTVEMQIRAVRSGLRCAEVPVSYRPRIGTSKISGTISGSIRAGWKIVYTIVRHAIFTR